MKKTVIIAIVIVFAVATILYAKSNMGLGLGISMKLTLSEPVASASNIVTVSGNNIANLDASDVLVT